MSFNFIRPNIQQYVETEHVQPEPVNKNITLVITDEMQLCLKDADEVSLLLVASGVTKEDLATYVRVASLLQQAEFSKEVTSTVQRKWNKVIDDCKEMGMSRDIVHAEYVSRTSIRRTVVDAFAALLHIRRKKQTYVSVLPDQEDRHEMPEGFLNEFSDYQTTAITDVVSSRELLVKVTKTGCDNYKTRGGLGSVVSCDATSQNFVPTLQTASEALMNSDKATLVSKIADPFHFVGQGIQNIKQQSYEHMACKRLPGLFPQSLFINVDSKHSDLDLENHHLTDLPLNQAVYLKYKPPGAFGDIVTNLHIYEHLGIKYTQIEPDCKADDVDRYAKIAAATAHDAFVSEIAIPGFIDLVDGYKFGDRTYRYVFPSRFHRLASVEDLKLYSDSLQLVSMPVLAGALKKSGFVFSTHRYYLLDVMAQICLAVPRDYVNMIESLGAIDAAPLSASKHGCLFVTSANVAQYVNAATEVNTYLMPILYKWYNAIDRRSDIPVGMNAVVAAIVRPITGVSFGRLMTLQVDQMSMQYSFLLGACKSDDRRVSNFGAELKLDEFDPQAQFKDDQGMKSKSITPVNRRKLNFDFTKRNLPPSSGTGMVDADARDTLQNSNSSIDSVTTPQDKEAMGRALMDMM